EEHGVRAERSIRSAGLEEMDGRSSHPERLDFASPLLAQLVALFLVRPDGPVHESLPRDSGDAPDMTEAAGAPARASAKAAYELAPRRAKMTWAMVGLERSSSRTAATVI